MFGKFFKKFMKLVLFNIFITACLVLSIIGLISSSSAFAMASCVTALVISIVSFFYFNKQILLGSPKHQAIEQSAVTSDEVLSLDECERAVMNTIHFKTFNMQMTTVRDQIRRLRKKKDTVRTILLRRFTETEMSYGRFQSIVADAEEVICSNIKSILNRLTAFDEEEYSTIRRIQYSGHSDDIVRSKMEIYSEYITFVNKSVGRNEEVLLKIDKLISEISKLDSLEIEEVDKMIAIKELDALIEDTKWYK